jgi:hypothetical protein
MSPSLSSDAMTITTSLATTTLTARSPLLDIVLCSSLSAAAEDCGGVDSMTDSSLTVDSVWTDFEARRHTRMLKLGCQDSLRRRRSTPSNWFNEQFPQCSTKTDKSLEVGVLQWRQEQQSNYNSGKLTQLAAATTTMAAIEAKFASTKAFPNCKRIKLLRFLLNIETSHTICSLWRMKDCQQSVTKIDPWGTKINKLVVQQRRRE